MIARRVPTGVLRPFRWAWIGFFFAGFLVAGASAATAYWSIPVLSGANSHAMAQAGTLAVPETPAATAVGSDAISISWSVPEDQLPGARYRVTRTGGPGSGTVVCAFATDTECQDTSVSAGTTYTYSVKAVLGTRWESAPVTASATTLGVTTSSLPAGAVGTAYTSALSATGGSGTYTSWALTSGTLPGGLSLNAATGLIAGTPSAAGVTSGLRFTVTDSLGRTATSGPLGLTVAKGSSAVSVSVSPTTVTYGAVSQAVLTISGLNSLTPAPTGSVTVAVGAATCVVTLPGTTCTIGNTALGVGGPYAVSATYGGDHNWSGSTGLAGTGLTVTRAPATVSLSANPSTAVYGSATGLVFSSSVTGGNGLTIPNGDTVTVSSGTTQLCTMTLTSGNGTCSPSSGTALPAGTHAVTATFNKSDSDANFVTTATASTSVTISPAPATVTAFSASGSPAVYGYATGLAFTASVVGPNGLPIPSGDTVTVSSGPTKLCTITLSAGSGSCSPASGTVLPVGTHTVTATFNSSGSDPNFVTTATATTSIRIAQYPGFVGIEWVPVSTSGTFTCDNTDPRAVTCTVTGAGNKGGFQASVRLVGASPAQGTNATGAGISVTQVTTGGGGTTTSAGSLTIAPLASTTPGSYTLTLNPGSPPTTTITASVTVDGITYTVTCAVSR